MARPPLLPDFDLRHTVLDLKTDLVIPVSQSRRRPAHAPAAGHINQKHTELFVHHSFKYVLTITYYML